MSTSSGPGCIRYDWEPCPDSDYAFTRFYWSSNPVFGAGVLRSRDSTAGSFTVLSTHDATVYGWVVHYNRSGQASARYPSGNGFDAVSGYIYDVDIYNGSVDTAKIAASSVTRKYHAFTSAAVTLTTASQTIQSDDVAWLSDYEAIVFEGSFYIAGNTSDIPIQVELYVGSSLIATFPTIVPKNTVVRWKRLVSKATMDGITGATAGTINLKASTTTGTVNISARMLLTMVYKR
jgi:hypothetical protein